jgi:hypothetical protein
VQAVCCDEGMLKLTKRGSFRRSALNELGANREVLKFDERLRGEGIQSSEIYW